MLNSRQRKILKQMAHSLNPTVMIGQNGLTDSVADKTRSTLESHELIKCRFVEHKEERHALAVDLARMTDSELVAVIGHTAVLFRPHPDPEKRSIRLPR